VKRLAGIGLLLLALVSSLIFRGWWQNRLERRAEGPILAAARRYGVEPALVKAVVWRESGFHPDARGRVGELGLMQLQAKPAEEWARAEHIVGFSHGECLDPATNTLAGTWYLRKVLQRYTKTDNPLPFALADYNAGRRNVLKWLKGAAATNSEAFMAQIDFPGTRKYVQVVLERYLEYRPFEPEGNPKRSEQETAGSPARW
jgi:peptidoglycan lytic transglycosylase